jgi:hypothetical protein
VPRAPPPARGKGSRAVERRCAAYRPAFQDMGHTRGHGVTRLLVYCESLWCNHSATLDGDWLTDDTILLTLDPRMVCTAPRGRRYDWWVEKQQNDLTTFPGPKGECRARDCFEALQLDKLRTVREGRS